MLGPVGTMLTCEAGPYVISSLTRTAGPSGPNPSQSAARPTVRNALAEITGGGFTNDVVLVTEEPVGAVQPQGPREDATVVPGRRRVADEEDEDGARLLPVDVLADVREVQRNGKGKRIVAILLYPAEGPTDPSRAASPVKSGAGGAWPQHETFKACAWRPRGAALYASVGTPTFAGADEDSLGVQAA